MMNGEETDGGISLGDMEKALVCLLMTSMEAPVQAESAGLTQEMFADASLGFVYEVIMKIYATGVRPDMVLVERGMREADEELAAKLGGLSFLLPYMLNVRHDGNVAAYVEGIKKQYKLRCLVTLFGTMAFKAGKVSSVPEELVDEAERLLMQFRQKTAEGAPVRTIGELAAEAVSWHYRRFGGELEAEQVKSGLAEFDYVTGGFHNTELTIVAGRPSDGKTAVTLQMALNAARAGKSVCFFSLEMSSLQMLNRVLAGMTEQRSRAEILEEIWKYTHIPVCIKSGEQETEEWVGISREEAEQECGKRMEYKLSEKNGVVMAVVPEGVNKESVEELLELLAKSYHMRTHTRETEEREIPDYMWIITEEPKNLIHIGRDLTKQARVNKMLTGLKLRQIQDNELFISGMDGKEARNGIIDVCRKSMEDEDGKIMIGNGFSDWGKKEENRQLQWQVLNMAVRQKQKEQVLLVENYYHELAISCISENLGQENIYLEELEILKEEDRKTGKELYKTLYWYLRMKRNVAQTAARLRIHRNTLLPRIARINELLDLDEKDGMECERILMGMEIEKLKND